MAAWWRWVRTAQLPPPPPRSPPRAAPPRCAAKFGALFASIPQALVAGVFTVMFSLISGVGACGCGPAAASVCAVLLWHFFQQIQLPTRLPQQLRCSLAAAAAAFRVALTPQATPAAPFEERASLRWDPRPQASPTWRASTFTLSATSSSWALGCTAVCASSVPSSLPHCALRAHKAATAVPDPAHVGPQAGLSVPDYFSTYTSANGHGPVNTGAADARVASVCARRSLPAPANSRELRLAPRRLANREQHPQLSVFNTRGEQAPALPGTFAAPPHSHRRRPARSVASTPTPPAPPGPSTGRVFPLMACLLLDLTVPADPGDRGQEAWQRQL